MAKTFKIYTAGKMGGLTLEQQMLWRYDIEKRIKAKTDVFVKFIHPPLFYQYGGSLHKSELEAMQWDLDQIRDSDIVVVNLSNISDSIGTHMEIGFAQGLKTLGKRINVVGFGIPNTNHPWIQLSCIRQEDNIEDAADYISSYLLV